MRDRPRSRVLAWPIQRLHPAWIEVSTRLAVPLAVLAAGWSLAGASLGDSAETTYLTLLATGVLTAVAWLTPRPTADLGVGAVLAVLLLWIVPAGPTRGAGMTFLLLALVAIAAARRWSPLLAPRPTRRSEAEPPSWSVLATATVPAVLALHALMGARDLVGAGPDVTTAIRFLLVPAMVAGSVAVLARIHGAPPALIAGAAAMTLGGGAGPSTAWILAALAGGSALAAPATVLPVRVIAGLAVVAPLFWQQRAGAIAAACGLALAAATFSGSGSGSPRLRAVLSLLPALMVLGIAVWAPLHPWNEAAERALWLLAAVPALLLVLRKSPALAVSAAILALAAARVTSDLTTLAAPAALAALALSEFRQGSSRMDTAGVTLQGLWSALLLAAAVLAATYPWLRTEMPARTALSLVQMPAAPSTVVHFGGRVLDAESPDLELDLSTDLSDKPIRRVVLDTHLAHADGVAAGTRVAVLQLEDSTGRSMEWPLRAGTDTGEWAAARSDLARRKDLTTPAPWLSQVVTDKDGAWFFARRYRAVLDLQGPSAPERLVLRRDPGLAPEVTLAVFHVAVFRVEARP